MSFWFRAVAVAFFKLSLIALGLSLASLGVVVLVGQWLLT